MCQDSQFLRAKVSDGWDVESIETTNRPRFRKSQSQSHIGTERNHVPTLNVVCSALATSESAAHC